MRMRIYDVNSMYKKLCTGLLADGRKVGNTLELENVQFTINAKNNNIISCRDISLPYLFGELTWYFAGSQSMKFISKFGSLWGRISDDGETSNSAYGHTILKRHGFDQLDKMIELLKKDPLSRRAVININVPNSKVIETKDEPCTIMLQFLIRDGKLNCTGVMRSNDIWFGLPYDIVFFTEIQRKIAKEVGVDVGTYTHCVTSLHVYERDIEKIKNVVFHFNPVVINCDFSKLWPVCNEIYDAVNEADDPKNEILKQFKKYRIYKEAYHE